MLRRTIFSFVFGDNEENVTTFLVRLPIGFLINQKSSKIKPERETFRVDSPFDKDSKNINYIGECPNFQEGTVGKIRENGEFFYYAQVGNSELKFWQVPLLSIFRHSITIRLHYKKL